MELKKGKLYTIIQKGSEPIEAFFDKTESAKYLRFKTKDHEPILVKKSSVFHEHETNSPIKYNRRRVEFEPTPVMKGGNKTRKNKVSRKKKHTSKK